MRTSMHAYMHGEGKKTHQVHIVQSTSDVMDVSTPGLTTLTSPVSTSSIQSVDATPFGNTAGMEMTEASKFQFNKMQSRMEGDDVEDLFDPNAVTIAAQAGTPRTPKTPKSKTSNGQDDPFESDSDNLPMT